MRVKIFGRLNTDAPGVTPRPRACCKRHYEVRTFNQEDQTHLISARLLGILI